MCNFFPKNIVLVKRIFTVLLSDPQYVAVMLQELDVRLEQAILTDLVQVRVAVTLYLLHVCKKYVVWYTCTWCL